MRSVYKGVPRYSFYALDPNVKVLEIGEHQLLVNPQTGGWVELDDLEMTSTLNPGGIEPVLGESLFQVGIATRNGVPIYKQHSHPLENALFHYKFNLGPACTLRCQYCFSNAGPEVCGDSMSWSVAKKAIDRIVDHCRSTSLTQVRIEFTGGEPLLYWDVMEKSVRYCRSFEEISWEHVCQSNLTLVKDEWIPALKELKLRIAAGIDGPRDIHDLQRPLDGASSFETTWRNVCRLREAGVVLAGAISVVTNRGQTRLPEIARFLADRGFYSLALLPVQLLGRAAEDPSLETEGPVFAGNLLRVLYDVIIPHYRKTGKVIKERHLGTTLGLLLQPQRRSICHRTPCGAGRNTCSIAPNGDVYPCNQSPFLEMRLGSVEEQSFSEILASPVAQYLSRRVIENIPECNECVYSGWCQSPCSHYALVGKGALLAKSPFCDHYRTLIHGLLTGLLGRTIEPDIAEALASAYDF